MKMWWFCLIFVVMLAFAFSAQSKSHKEIEELFGDEEEIEVIVVLYDDYNTLSKYGISDYEYKDDFEMKKNMIREQQEGVLSGLKQKKKDKGLSAQSEDYDFELTNTYSTVNGFAGKLKKSSFQKLRNNPKILGIYKPKNLTLLLSDSKNIVNVTHTWSLVYGGTNITGRGETVCIIDTGVDYTHPALGNCSTTNFTNGVCPKVISGYDFVNSDNDPIDDNGHGTHVAGVVASTDSNYRGIAPDASIVAIKILNAAGLGNTANLINGIDWCVNNASIFNISAISLSLGLIEDYKNTTYCDTSDNPSLVSLIHTAISRNISVVVAAGNDGASPLGVNSPACISNVTVVGSTDKDDAISSFSDRWALPMLFAPGSSIISTNLSGGFISQSGTSMATPHIAGAFALLRQYRRLEQNIILTPSQIQDALNDTSKQISDSGLTFSRINIYAAVLSLDTIKPGITFVNPTPSNNTNLSLNSTEFFVYINASTSEVLSSAILEINNGTKTNASMTINGLNSFINLTSLKVGVVSFRIYGNDSAGNSNVTGLRVLQINNTAPNISGFAPSSEFVSIVEPNNQTFSVNFSDRENDTITFSWFLNNSLYLSGINRTEFNFTGNLTAAGFYVVNVTLDDGSQTAYRSWNLTVNNTNTIPNVTFVNLTNTDFLNRTNGTLQAFWSFNDADGDIITANETLWYINNSLISDYTNKTFIHSLNTTKLENWTFSVRVFDDSNWSEFANSSNITILNANPSLIINTTAIILSETQQVNITLSASDLDNDLLNYTTNNSRFFRQDEYFIWSTNLSDSGFYLINITVNDSFDIDSLIINATINDARDLDNDGNPDFNESDDDNDGISDENDFLTGNMSSINTTLPINITINGTSNLSNLFNGTFAITITNGSDEFMEFNFTFSSLNILDFGNLTINRTTIGSSAVAIRGLRLANSTKAVFLEKINTTVKAVCIKDADAGFDAISSSCDAGNETLLACNNQSSGQYTCFDTGTRYKITGLNHSAVKEQCRDADGDGYGTGCSAGDDCNDNDASKTTSCSSSSSGSSGGGSSGGGGGGGGAGLFFVCNMDWVCNDWGDCVNGYQTRQCNFVKVPQHTSDVQCPSLSSPPITSQKCEVPQVQTALAVETCFDNIKNQDEGGIDCGGVCKSCGQINNPVTTTASKQDEAQSGFVGFAVKNLVRQRLNVFIAAIVLISIVLSVFAWRKFRRKP